MKIALIHNPDAFSGEAADSEMRRVFQRAGHEVTYISIQEPDWQRAIAPENERVIIAGGDGTVQSVARHLRGKPFSILPFGTANNIARCLCQTSNPERLASHMNQAEIHHLDLVYVRERRRENLCRWIEGQSAGHTNATNFERWRCRRVETQASNNAPVHIDSSLIQKPGFPIVIELEAAALDYAVVPGWEKDEWDV